MYKCVILICHMPVYLKSIIIKFNNSEVMLVKVSIFNKNILLEKENEGHPCCPIYYPVKRKNG